jgi:hypothetical protein
MNYDLRRLRLLGLIERLNGTNAYAVTNAGIRAAVFITSPGTACSPRRSNRIDLPRCSRSVGPSPPSTTASTPTSSTPDWARQLETCHMVPRSEPQEELDTPILIVVMARSRTATLTWHSSRAIDFSNYSYAQRHPRLGALVWHSLNSSSEICPRSYRMLKVEQGLCNDPQVIDR